ncbi:MAG: class I SAM-dependent methyltransferase [Bacteroidetes bacterium]|nr:MAG: class I SAM-dependent methyltransferase [Bacteroidota bacterium]
MRIGSVFDKYAQDYEEWFTRNEAIYQLEVAAVQAVMPSHGLGLEVGVGTGRFAQPLGIKIGIDPASTMLRLAQARGAAVCQAFGEQLPFQADQFDFVLLVTVICFVKNLPLLFTEIQRVIKPGGHIIIGLIDKNSPLGKVYESQKASSKFYQAAHFYTVEEVSGFLNEIGFSELQYRQTLFADHTEADTVEQITLGYGQGSFVVVRATSTKREENENTFHH